VPWLLAECACRSAEEGENDSLTSRSEQIGLQKIDDFATPTINYGQYCPEDGFRNPANPMQGKGLNAVLVFFDLKSEESKAAFSEENR
jgi:hypothetical protein